MGRFSPLLVVLPLALLASCDSLDQSLLEPNAVRSSILDGRDTELDGSGVFLLPPVGTNDYTRTGAFDIDAVPRLEICRLDVQGEITEQSIEDAACVDGVADYWFERDAAWDGESFIAVTPTPGGSASDSMFSVGWKTQESDAGTAFRGSILVPSLSVDGSSISVVYQPAAQFDIVLYDNASTKLDADRVVGFNAGQNFPLKFIVEQNAGCDGLDCFAYEVTCQAGVYQTSYAGVYMPEDWAGECDVSDPGPERNWWLFQERLPEGTACLPSGEIDGIPFEPCYVWQLAEEIDSGSGITFQPYTQEFDEPVTIQFCDDFVPHEYERLTGVFRYSVPPGEVALVPGTEEEPFEISCPYNGPTTVAALTGLRTLTDGVIRPALELVGLAPRPLYAGDTGTLSSKTIRMSHFQRVMQLTLAETTDLSSAALVGGSAEMGIRLVSPPHHEPLDGPSAGVPGVVVQFQVTSGSATLSGGGPCTGVTDGTCVVITTSDGATFAEDGFASATLRLGSASGPITVEVTVPEDPDFTALAFNVDAVELVTVFLEPLETGDVYGAPDQRFEPTILICAVGAEPCTGGPGGTAAAEIPTSEIKLVEENGRKFYQAGWKPRDTGTAEGGTYTTQVMVGGAVVGYSIPIVVTKGGKSERIEDVYYNGVNSSLPLKFTITPAGS